MHVFSTTHTTPHRHTNTHSCRHKPTIPTHTCTHKKEEGWRERGEEGKWQPTEVIWDGTSLKMMPCNDGVRDSSSSMISIWKQMLCHFSPAIEVTPEHFCAQGEQKRWPTWGHRPPCQYPSPTVSRPHLPGCWGLAQPLTSARRKGEISSSSTTQWVVAALTR